MRTLLCVLLVAAAAAGCVDNLRPLVATREGLVRGVVRRSAAGATFFSFKGIPFAQPPVGELRFQPPRRHPGWSGVADALEHGSRCLQFDFMKNMTLDGSEDCLFANVYTPNFPAVNIDVGRLPVMVFVHGGGFSSGNGDEDFYGPLYFMDEDVVLVTFNYRLGVFGFFNTRDSLTPGNYGLLDQVLLLKWLQDNIASFGGDPRAVTIFGESAGGSSVSMLVLSPLSKGLFHHAISQSGSAITAYGASKKGENSANKMFKLLNCSSDDICLSVECVRGVPSNLIMEAIEAMGKMELHFYPRVDREAQTPFLPKDPRIVMENGEFHKVPWMIGLNEEEGALFLGVLLADKATSAKLFAGDIKEWGKLSQLNVDAEVNVVDCGFNVTAQLQKVQDFYIGNSTVSYANLLPISRLVGDRWFVIPGSEEVRLASAHAPVYKYFLNEKGPGREELAKLVGLQDDNFGTTHSEDLLFLFKNNLSPIPPAGSSSYTMIRFMVSLWTSFARTGRPSSDVLPMPDWPIYTEQSQRHMQLNLAPSVGERLFEKRVQFWQSLPINQSWRHPVRREPCPAPAPVPEEHTYN